MWFIMGWENLLDLGTSEGNFNCFIWETNIRGSVLDEALFTSSNLRLNSSWIQVRFLFTP